MVELRTESKSQIHWKRENRQTANFRQQMSVLCYIFYAFSTIHVAESTDICSSGNFSLFLIHILNSSFLYIIILLFSMDYQQHKQKGPTYQLYHILCTLAPSSNSSLQEYRQQIANVLPLLEYKFHLSHHKDTLSTYVV